MFNEFTLEDVHKDIAQRHMLAIEPTIRKLNKFSKILAKQPSSGDALSILQMISQQITLSDNKSEFDAQILEATSITERFKFRLDLRRYKLDAQSPYKSYHVSKYMFHKKQTPCIRLKKHVLTKLRRQLKEGVDYYVFGAWLYCNDVNAIKSVLTLIKLELDS